MPTPLDYFQMESAERLARLGAGLLALERTPSDAPLIDDLFREAHSLKGAAGVTGLTEVAAVCHKMEDILSGVREGAAAVGGDMIDALLLAADAVEEMVASHVEKRDCTADVPHVLERLGGQGAIPAEGASTASPAEMAATALPEELTAWSPAAPRRRNNPALDPSLAEVPSAGEPESETVASTEVHAQPAVTDTVRLRVSQLEELGNRTGELMVAGDRLRLQLGVVGELQELIRAGSRRHQDDLALQNVLQPIAAVSRRLVDQFATDCNVIEPLIAEIHESVLDTRLLPLSILFDQLPRFVRDHCRREEREAELVVVGADTRVDRQVLEQLRDPIIHMIRNALTHGLETPAERAERGKPAAGTVRLTTVRRGDRIRVTCEDDGRGIDRASVLAKALAKRLITETEAGALQPEEIDRLILEPGISTARMITDVTGRGVGMDVVLSRVGSLRGTLEICSEPGISTTFVLEFPASVMTREGLLVEAEGYTYIVPTAAVTRTHRVKVEDVQVGAGGEALTNIEGESVPLHMLASLLGIGDGELPNVIPLVIVRYGDRQVGLGVDRLVGTQMIVEKGLGAHIGTVRGVAGATVLGTGLPALILDPAALIKRGSARPLRRAAHKAVVPVETKRAPVLVVDDSITTRMMEQSILESAGYEVDTAVSAEDALERIQSSSYELFVVDVEMPGLNGFQLTRTLRGIERFADTPIVIVSSLAKEAHRREGLESGANAYIIKGEFDQNVLLDTVERLVGQ